MRSVTKHLHTALLALGLSFGSAGLAAAQTEGDRGGGENRNLPQGQTNATRDRGFDWGMLGLLGLAGLIPLFVRRDNGHRHYGHTTTAGRGTAGA